MNNLVGYVYQELQAGYQKLAPKMPVYDKLIKALSSNPGCLPRLNQLNFDDADLGSKKNFVYFMRYALDAIGAHLGKGLKDTIS